MGQNKGIVLGVVGAVIGGYISASPQGAYYGWTIGSAIGGAITPGKKTYQYTPTLNDLKIFGTEYGQPIPFIQGADATAGQIWWNTDRRAIQTTTIDQGEGKGEGPTTTTVTTTYDMDLLVGLSDNVIIGVSRIWMNGKMIWTKDITAGSASIVASDESPFWDRITVYTGDAAQLPDPTYEAVVGIGNAPAYRGRGSVFIQGLKLGQSGQVPNMVFEVVANGYITPLLSEIPVHTPQFANDQGIAPLVSLDYTGWWRVKTSSGTIRDFVAADLLTQLQLAYFEFDDDSQISPVAVNDAGSMFARSPTVGGVPKALLLTKTGSTVAYNGSGVGDSMQRPGSFDSSGSVWATAASETDKLVKAVLTLGDPGDPNNFAMSLIATSYTAVELLGDAGRIPGRIYFHSTGSSGTRGISWIDTTTLTITSIKTAAGLSQPTGVVDADGFIFSADFDSTGHFVRLIKLTTNGVPVATGLLDENITDIQGMVVDSVGILWVDAGFGVTRKMYKVDKTTMALLDTAEMGFSHHIILDHGVPEAPLTYATAPVFRIYMIAFEDAVVKVPMPVDESIEELLLRAGLRSDQFDVTALAAITKDVASLSLTQVSPTRQTIDLLASVFFFEMTVSDKIYCRPRGGATVATIPYVDLGARTGEGSSGNGDDPLVLRQNNDLELPAQVSITYRNISDDYQNDTQFSDRLISAAAETLNSMQVPIGLTPSDAKAVADVMLLDQAATVLSTKLALLGDYAYLEPTDVVLVIGKDGSAFRFRLVRRTDTYPVLEFEAVLDDASVLESQGITSVDYTSSTTVAAVPATDMELMDIPILQDSDNDSGFYVAAKGANFASNWTGATIFSSTNNVDYAAETSLDRASVMGGCSTALGNWTGPRVFDEMNSVSVVVGPSFAFGGGKGSTPVDSGILASTTRTLILNSQSVNAALIGDEIIQFRTATLVANGTYVLTGLLRGSRGTEWAMGTHAIGDRFVLLRSDALSRIHMPNAELGIQEYYKGVTFGKTLSSAAAELFTNNGVGLKPFSPVHLHGERDASGNITFTWQRRTRISVRMIGALGISVPLGEESESYALEVYSSGAYSTLLRTITSTTPSASYTAAQQTADGLTPGAPVYVKLFQVSVVVGRGTVLQKAA